MSKARNVAVAATFVVTSGLVATFASGSLDERGSAARPEMVWIAGATFWMGSSAALLRDAQPVHRVRLSGFWMDTTEVTNEQFAAFVRATGYVTLAERPPSSEDAPDIPAQMRAAGSLVFSPPREPAPLDAQDLWWRFVVGANWQHPQGPDSDLSGRAQEPAVHIAYPDAVAYATWARKRLPTEAEWERVAGADPWFVAPNLPPGSLGPLHPVAMFAPNQLGLFDLTDNVGEWVSDVYGADYYAQLSATGATTRDPRGPRPSDAGRRGLKQRVQRGSPFVCTDERCVPYVPGARAKAVEHATSDRVGFRCVRDVSR